jgi:C1A family cysteine protease
MSDILPLSPSGRRYGLYPDNPAQPARKLLRIEAPTALILPPKATTSQWMGQIRDQGQEGSCTGQMGAALRDALYRKLFVFEKDKTVLPQDFMSSASFIYKNNLIADGNLGQDVGSTIHQTFITLNQKGTCLDSQEPYHDTDYSNPPSAQQYADALPYRGGAYHLISDLQTMKSVIASGYPFGFGINVYDSFESDWAEPGMMPMPDIHRETLLGGHAQAVFDYDDTIHFPDGNVGGLLIQNSWGVDWGLGGKYWMPYAFVLAGQVSDAWIMHLGPAWR